MVKNLQVGVDQYISNSGDKEPILLVLRKIIQATELEETIKWNQPTYTLKGKNVLSICSFKNGAGIWFFNGVLLKDKLGVITNAQGGKTHGMRRWIFANVKEVDNVSVLEYIKEAIQNEKDGKRVKRKRGPVVVSLPVELEEALDAHVETKEAFNALTPGKQKEYAEYISSAKRPVTKSSRLTKILPMISARQGLNDRYLKRK